MAKRIEHLEAVKDECRKYGAEVVSVEICAKKIKCDVQIQNKKSTMILSKTPSDYNVQNRVRREARWMIAKLLGITINELKINGAT